MIQGQDQVTLAVEVVSDPLQHPEVRLRAQNVIDQVKAIASGSHDDGDAVLGPAQAEQLLSLCASLISSQASTKAYLEKKLFGISVLQQLVTQQWTDLTEDFKQRTSLFIVECCRSLCVTPEASNYAIKSKLSVLFADMARYMATDPANAGAAAQPNGPSGAQSQGIGPGGGDFDSSGNAIRTYVLPEITTWPGTRGIELACLVLRWLPEGKDGAIVEGLPMPRKRILLKVLHASLPDMITFAFGALEKYYAALCQIETSQSQKEQELQLRQEYKHVVEAALSMALSYAEWAPITLLHQSGIINACGILMRDKRFRDVACDVLRQQAACKLKPIFVTDVNGGKHQQQQCLQQVSSAASTQTEVQQAKAAARAIFEAFAGPSQDYLGTPAEYASLGHENVEFGHLLCETMVIWGKNHVKLLEGTEELSLFLRMVMAFLQHENANLAIATTDFWTLLIKEALVGGDQKAEGAHGDRKILGIPDGFLAALLDVIVLRLQKPVLDSLEDYPAEFYDSAKDYHGKSALLRQRVVEISRTIARNAPEEVFRVCLGNLEKIFILIQQNPSAAKIEVPLEAATHLLFVATGAAQAQAVAQSPALEALLHKLLGFPIQMVTQAPIIMQFVKCLESIGGFAHRIVPVVQCLLALLRADAGKTIVSEEKHAARQQAATTVMTLVGHEGAAKALFQHVTSLLAQIQDMWTQGVIRAGERNALYEAVLIISSFLGFEQQEKTLEWLWAETCAHLGNASWQENTLTDALALLRKAGIKACACNASDPSFDPVEAGKERLRIYHGVQLIERLSRKLLKMKRTKGSNVWLAVVPHFKWTIPLVVRLLRCIHYLATPDGQKLMGQCCGALKMGEVERAFVLGITPTGVSPAAYVSATAGGEFMPTSSSSIGMEGDGLESLRTFLRGMRDSCYQYLGIAAQVKVDDDNVAASIGFKSFFDHLATATNEFYAVSMENLECQDDRSARMLIRGFVSPMVKACPQHCWRQWLGTILPPLLQHMHARLTTTWHAYLTGAPTNTGGMPGTPRTAPSGPSSQTAPQTTVQQEQLARAGGVAVEVGEEILEETSMREITREHLSLILIIATGDEMGHTYFQNKKKGNAAVTTTVFQWLAAECAEAASSVLATAVAALTWPDTETGMKAIKACRIALATTQNSGGQLGSLQSFIAKEMFTACMSCLTLPSHVDFQSEILLVLRDIILRHPDLVNALLLTLPNINESVLASFHQAMRTKGSEKDQRNLVRKLLLRSGGSELKALAQQHSPGTKIPQLQSSDFGTKANKSTALPLLDTLGSQEQSPLQNLF